MGSSMSAQRVKLSEGAFIDAADIKLEGLSRPLHRDCFETLVLPTMSELPAQPLTEDFYADSIQHDRNPARSVRAYVEEHRKHSHLLIARKEHCAESCFVQDADNDSTYFLQGNEDCEDRFQDCFSPPELHGERLELTTVRSMLSPHTIGNALLDFFRESCIASVNKCNIRKYTMLVDAFANNRTCEAKVRIYKDVDASYAIEVQRRQGDTLVFHRLYQEVSDVLHRSFEGTTKHQSPASFAPLPVQESIEEPQEGHLDALLDWAFCSTSRSEQADVAVGLAALAEDQSTIPLFCSAHVYRAFAKLVRCSDKEVAYPTARALRCLTKCAKFSTALIGADLFDAILTSVQSPNTNQVVQTLLAQSLSMAVSRFDETVLHESRSELMQSLRDAFRVGAAARRANKNCSELKHVL